ncbi:ISAs1 family transposase [Cupriavidus sp. D39]|uniref:ISAs1 family transposase n=1 Tax=Cupriavidus sp. D39 TaxID=2997877 RepID=UPI00226EE14B|nr:ISAs1 family transposase [Cupriavidus sp. D39]MCY0853254.1 ISAs1 family transposase [Cupriavidus sp. D39]
MTWSESSRAPLSTLNRAVCIPLDGRFGTEPRRLESVAVAAPDYLSELDRWPKLKSLVRIERTRDIGGQVSVQTQYLISSAAPDAKLLLEASRMHWAIGNGLHHCLDVIFREDASTVRLRNATANFATLRRITLNLLRMRPESGKKKRSLAARRKIAGWNPDYSSYSNSRHGREFDALALDSDRKRLNSLGFLFVA